MVVLPPYPPEVRTEFNIVLRVAPKPVSIPPAESRYIPEPLNWRPVEIFTESKVRSVPMESGVPVRVRPLAPDKIVVAPTFAVAVVRMLTAYEDCVATNALKPTANRMV